MSDSKAPAPSEEQLHWADEKELVSSNRPIKLLLTLLKIQPKAVVHILIFPVAFFYFAFSKRARNECRIYQERLREFSGGKSPKKISSYRQIVSFCLCVLEKMEGWLGKYVYKELITHDDALGDLQARLEQGKGAVLLGSHLGNIELMRSLADAGENGVERKFSVITLMELKSTDQFNKTLMEINPNVGFKVIDPSQIGPDTIITLQEELEKGALVVIAGDRTSARSRGRCIRKDFLGKPADFPYGVYLMAALLKFPVYHAFALRNKTATLLPVYNMYVEKSQVDFDCPRSERESRISECCDEFVRKLEKYCMMYPYQWYNFYNFWNIGAEADNGNDEHDEHDKRDELAE